jgi:hypothetical protein
MQDVTLVGSAKYVRPMLLGFGKLARPTILSIQFQFSPFTFDFLFFFLVFF